MEAVQRRQVAFARHAEGMGDALGQKAFDKNMAGDALGHGNIMTTPLSG